MKNTKIRMIFCDVDGTLMPHDTTAPSKDVLEAINRAISSDVILCIASGRSYSDLKKLFAPVAENVIFICNDGALAVKCDEILFSSSLNNSQLACMSRTYKNDYKAMFLYAKNKTYYISDDTFDFAEKTDFERLSSNTDNIYKIAFLNLSQKAKFKLNNLGIKSGILNKVYEDNSWTEYITAQTDKGTAAEFLQKKFDIPIRLTAAFGDNLNDFGMLRRAQFTFAPKNAHPEVVKMCKYTTDNVTNDLLNIILKGENYE